MYHTFLLLALLTTGLCSVVKYDLEDRNNYNTKNDKEKYTNGNHMQVEWLGSLDSSLVRN